MNQDVYITGRGMITSLGCDVDVNWQRVTTGETGLRASVMIDNTSTADLLGYCEAISGRNRLLDIAEQAFNECLSSAELSEADLNSAGLVFAHSSPASELIVREAGRLSQGKRGRPDSLYRTMENHVASRLAAKVGIAGPVISNSAACCGSAQSILIGRALIKSGSCELCICGGADVIDIYTYHAFKAMRIVLAQGESLAATSIMPYGQERAGIALGEGSGFVVLESASNLQRRGVHALARLENVVQINHPDARFGDISDKQVWTELLDKTLDGASVDYVVGHGTSTILGDEVEARAVMENLEHCPITSTKYHFGHTLAASSALDIALLCVSFLENEVIGSGSHYHLDPALASLNLVQQSYRHTINSALKISAGFGGALNCVHLCRA